MLEGCGNGGDDVGLRFLWKLGRNFGGSRQDGGVCVCWGNVGLYN